MINPILLLTITIGLAQCSPVVTLADLSFMGTFTNENGVMSTYYMSTPTNQKNYYDANDDCIQRGGTCSLVTMETEAEAHLMRTQLGTWGVTEKVWVAGEKYEGKWVWYNHRQFTATPCTYCSTWGQWDGVGSEDQGITIGGSGLSFKWTPAAKQVAKRFICEFS